jgi:hexosaminidase
MKSKIYSDTLNFKGSTSLKARAFKDGIPSVAIAENSFYRHLATGKTIKLTHSFSSRYSAGGEAALVNGIKGSQNYRDGNWQGFEQNNLEAVIDLGAPKNIKKISSSYFQSSGAHIFLPSQVEYEISSDGQNFQNIAVLKSDPPKKESGNLIKDFHKDLKNIKARYVRVNAMNIGFCPDWHPSAGSKAWLFADEIIIE